MVGVGLNCGDVGAWIVGVSGCGGGLETTGHQHGDRKAITYFTPRMSGVQLAASYIPNTDPSAETGNAKPVNNDNDAWAVGINATQSFGDTSVKISLGHRSASGNMDPVDLMSGKNVARITRGIHDDNEDDIKAYADALAKGGVGADLDTLADAAAKAHASNKGAMDLMGAHKGRRQHLHQLRPAGRHGRVHLRRRGGPRGKAAPTRSPRWTNPFTAGAPGTMTATTRPRWCRTTPTTTIRITTGRARPSSRTPRKDYEVVSVGTTYTDGPMAASLSYMMVDYGDGGESEATMLSFSYTLAPGIASKNLDLRGRPERLAQLGLRQRLRDRHHHRLLIRRAGQTHTRFS